MIYRALMRATVSLLVFAGGLVVMQAPAAAATRGPFQYEVLHAGKCLDNPRSNPNNGVAPIIYRCALTNPANQLWTEEDTGGGYVQIRNRASGKCLAVLNATTNVGQPIIQYTCNGTDNSEWKPVLVIDNDAGSDWYLLRNKKSNLCIHVKDGASGNGTTLVQETCQRITWDNNLWTWYRY